MNKQPNRRTDENQPQPTDEGHVPVIKRPECRPERKGPFYKANYAPNGDHLFSPAGQSRQA
jgi:hypothetical protein